MTSTANFSACYESLLESFDRETPFTSLRKARARETVAAAVYIRGRSATCLRAFAILPEMFSDDDEQEDSS